MTRLTDEKTSAAHVRRCSGHEVVAAAQLMPTAAQIELGDENVIPRGGNLMSGDGNLIPRDGNLVPDDGNLVPGNGK